MKAAIVALSLVLLIKLAESQESLQFVVQMSSIGARFPEDIVGDWVKEPGELTPVGMRQLYLLGRELRKKYVEEGKLIGEQYNPLEYIVRASYTKRAVGCSSAYALARGMFPPGSGYALKKEQIERAVPPANFTNYTEYQKELRDAALPRYFSSLPVMVYSGGPDYYLASPEYCENIPELIKNYTSGNSTLKEKLKEKQRVYKEGVYKELSTAFKTPIDSMEAALSYWDYIVSAYYYAQDLKIKISEAGVKQLREMSSLVRYESYFGDMMVARVVSNEVLKEMVNYINSSVTGTRKGAGTDVSMSMVSYMMHDTNVMGFLRLMNYSLSNFSAEVPFASSLQFEVFQKDPNNPNDFSLRVLYNGRTILWNDTKEDIDIQEFFDWSKGVLLKNFAVACHGEEKGEGSVVPWIAIAIVLGGALLVAIGVLFFCLCYKKKEDHESDDTMLGEKAMKTV